MMTRHTLVEMRRRDALRLAGTALLAVSGPLPVLAQGTPPLRIGMIGSGREGGALGTLFAKAGHQVMFSSRHPDDLKNLIEAAGPNAKAGTVEQAVAFGDVVAIVVPYAA